MVRPVDQDVAWGRKREIQGGGVVRPDMVWSNKTWVEDKPKLVVVDDVDVVIAVVGVKIDGAVDVSPVDDKIDVLEVGVLYDDVVDVVESFVVCFFVESTDGVYILEVDFGGDVAKIVEIVGLSVFRIVDCSVFRIWSALWPICWEMILREECTVRHTSCLLRDPVGLMIKSKSWELSERRLDLIESIDW